MPQKTHDSVGLGVTIVGTTSILEIETADVDGCVLEVRSSLRNLSPTTPLVEPTPFFVGISSFDGSQPSTDRLLLWPAPPRIIDELAPLLAIVEKSISVTISIGAAISLGNS